MVEYLIKRIERNKGKRPYPFHFRTERYFPNYGGKTPRNGQNDPKNRRLNQEIPIKNAEYLTQRRLYSSFSVSFFFSGNVTGMRRTKTRQWTESVTGKLEEKHEKGGSFISRFLTDTHVGSGRQARPRRTIRGRRDPGRQKQPESIKPQASQFFSPQSSRLDRERRKQGLREERFIKERVSERDGRKRFRRWSKRFFDLREEQCFMCNTALLVYHIYIRGHCVLLYIFL